MPDRRSIFRLLALAGFLLTVALALWLAELRPLLVLIVMGVALLVAWAVEWLSWRQDLLRLDTEAVAVRQGDTVYSTVPAPFLPPASEGAAETSVPTQPPPAEPEEPAPVEPSEPLEPPPVEAPVAGPTPEAPAPVVEPARQTAPASGALEPPAPAAARPALRPVPTPSPAKPAPARPVPQQHARATAAGSGVVDMRTRVTAQPRRWNLWDLERRARDEAQRDPIRYEEWSYLFVHLRQFATPDGSLPTEFDGLVRESFGELLEHAR